MDFDGLRLHQKLTQYSTVYNDIVSVKKTTVVCNMMCNTKPVQKLEQNVYIMLHKYGEIRHQPQYTDCGQEVFNTQVNCMEI